MERAIAETDRRREKQVEYNTANNITPESIKRSIHDIMNSVYERDHVLVEIGDGGMADDVISIGHNFEAVLGDLETRMREAAADLNFEEAARLRDEVKRLRATELAVVDDPTAKQRVVQGKAGAYAGAKQYGEAANLPRGSGKRGGNNTPRAASPSPRSSRGEGRGEGQAPHSGPSSRIHKPDLDEMGIATWHEVKPDRKGAPRKPTLDEMGPGTESKIYQPRSMTESMPNALPPRSGGAKRGDAPSSPGSGSKIIQPTNSRESGPEFGPAPRSSGGAPGHRGGWKKRT
jgi:excinuclease ABC subunit B